MLALNYQQNCGAMYKEPIILSVGKILNLIEINTQYTDRQKEGSAIHASALQKTLLLVFGSVTIYIVEIRDNDPDRMFSRGMSVPIDNR